MNGAQWKHDDSKKETEATNNAPTFGGIYPRTETKSLDLNTEQLVKPA